MAKAKRSKHDPNHRTRPELAVALIKLAASWFPDDHIIVTGDIAYGGKSVLSRFRSRNAPTDSAEEAPMRVVIQKKFELPLLCGGSDLVFL
jgi:3',5'-cyclic AMP phosphodiesterase CpdA